jgi:hypothetical protein
MDEKEANPVDVHVGGRLKQRRTEMKISQHQLGERLGLTFQQIQKTDVSLPFSGENEDGSRSYLHHSDWRPRGDEHLLDRPRRHHPTTADRFVAYSIV